MYYLMRDGIEDFEYNEICSISLKNLEIYNKFRIYNSNNETYSYINYKKLTKLFEDYSINQFLIFTESRIFLDKNVWLLSSGWIDADFYLRDLVHSFENHFNDIEFEGNKFRTFFDSYLCEVKMDLDKFLSRYTKLRTIKG